MPTLSATPSSQPPTTAASVFARLRAFRLAAPGGPAAPGRQPALDALRAIAALLVLASHLLGATPAVGGILREVGAGRGGVLLFFVLSGYVIGLTNRRPWAETSRRDYWSRRALRLLPLYVLSVAFSVAVAACLGRGAGLFNTLGHLACLQNMEHYLAVAVDPVWSNQALWTLHYELVFYSLFLLVWRFRPAAWSVFGTCLALGACGPALPEGLRFLSSYGIGFAFWLAGLALAWFPAAAARRDAAAASFPLLGLSLLLVATHHAAPIQVGFARLGLSLADWPWMSIGDLAGLPACVLLVGGAAGVLPVIGPRLRLLCALPPLLTVAAAAATGHSLSEPRWAVAAFCAAAGSLLLWRETGTAALVRRLARWGTISYAIYLFHSPLHKLAMALFPGGTFLVVVPTLALTFLLAHLLETRLQPWCVRRLRPALPEVPPGLRFPAPSAPPSCPS